MLGTDIHFNSIGKAVLIPFSFLIIFLFLNLYRYRKNSLRKLANPNILKEILIPHATDLYWFKTLALAMTWIFATLAFMDPTGSVHYLLTEKELPQNKKPHEVRKKPSTVIFLIDASDSMKVADSNKNLSRFEVAKTIADEVISRFTGQNISLYAFTSETTKLSPPTMDYLFVRLNLKAMSINEGDASGTDILDALTKIHGDYLSTFNSTYKNLILLTDGEDILFEDEPGDAKKKRLSAILSLFEHSKENRFKIYTIGLGTKEGGIIPGLTYEGKPIHSSLNEELLKKIGEAGNGKYYFAKDYQLSNLAEELIREIERKTSFSDEYHFNKQEMTLLGKKDPVYALIFQPFLACAIVFLGLAMFLPNTKERKKL